MSKIKWGKLIAGAAITGAVAGGLAYLAKHKNDCNELDDDFDDFDDDFMDEDLSELTDITREYVSIPSEAKESQSTPLDETDIATLEQDLKQSESDSIEERVAEHSSEDEQ